MGFGITPQRIEAMAAQWRSDGEAMSALRFPDRGTADGCRSLDGLNRCAAAATAAATALGGELSDLGVALSRFNAVTVDSDAQAAAEIVARGERR